MTSRSTEQQWNRVMHEKGAAQQRLAYEVATAVVPAQRGLQQMSVREALAAIQAGEYEPDEAQVCDKADSEPLTPGEVWFGEKIRLPSSEALKIAPEDKKQADPTSYFSKVKKLLQLVKENVQESREKYFHRMEERSKGNVQKKPKPLRVFNEGDEVTRYRPTKSKRVNKLAPMQEGPFRVVEVLNNGVSYKLKRIGSSEAEVKVHVDDIDSFKRWKKEVSEEPEASTSHC